MQAVNILMTMYRAMNTEEQHEVIRQIGKIAEDQGLWEAKTSASASATPKASRSGGGRKSWSAYWMKTATKIDTTKKGMFRVEGDWLKRPSDAKVGTLVIVGAKDPKHYWLCKTTSNASDTLSFESLGKTQTIECVVPIVAGSSYADIERAIEERI